MEKSNLTPCRIFCIGRNYAEHAQELSNPIPAKPVIFCKSPACIVSPGTPIRYPAHGHDLQHEVEVVIRIGKTGKATTGAEAISFVNAVTIGLDLTLRDVQADLKKKGLPWEIAKAFEQSAPLGEFVGWTGSFDLDAIEFWCKVNGAEKQRGTTADMLFCIEELIIELSKIWILRQGDLVFTGTPSGVGTLQIGDTITIESDLGGSYTWEIVD